MTALTTNTTAVLTVTADSSIDTLVDAFVRRYSADLAPASVATYSRAVKAFADWIGSRLVDIADITEQDVVEYKLSLLGRTPKLSQSTVSSYLTAARKFIRFLARRHVIAEDVAEDVPNVRRERGFRKDALNRLQVASLLAGVDRSSLDGLRDFAILLTMSVLGLRTIEISRADVGHLRSVNGRDVLMVWGKGRTGADEPMVLPAVVLAAIRDYLAARGPVAEDEPLFASCAHQCIGGRLATGSVSRIVKSAMRKAGMDSSRLTAHSLRHTAVTSALLAGQSIQQAQKLARHANINTTLVYAHNVDRILNAPEDAVAAYLGAAIA